MILNKTHSNPSDETQYTIFMNDIVRRWPSVEKIYYYYYYYLVELEKVLSFFVGDLVAPFLNPLVRYEEIRSMGLSYWCLLGLE